MPDERELLDRKIFPLPESISEAIEETFRQQAEESQRPKPGIENHAAGIITLPSGNLFYNDRFVREHQICKMIGDIAGGSKGRGRSWLRTLFAIGEEVKSKWPKGTRQDHSDSNASHWGWPWGRD